MPNAAVVAGSYIDGRNCPVDETNLIPVVNPATEEIAAQVGIGTEHEVGDAVAAARAAQYAWLRMPAHQRGSVLYTWAALIEANAEELARLDTMSVGRAYRDTSAEARGGGRVPRYWAGMADKIEGAQLPVIPGHLSYTAREPLGVVALILPWNGPVGAFVESVSAAIACGNAVVVKPSELAPLSALRLAELATQAGMPSGLVNVVTGDGSTGSLLVRHHDIDGIGFTGSVETGRLIARAAADRLTKVTLELGGKSPNIIFADADITEAIRGTTWGIFFNAGQVCCAGSRLLVERSIYSKVLTALSRVASTIRVGDPMDPANHIGPLACRRQYERVNSYLDAARADGADVVAGGGRPSTVFDRGYYVAPTILRDVDPRSAVGQEEIFGPVLSAIPFDDEDHALELANATRYGLAAKVWTADVGRMLRLARDLQAGSVWGNTAQAYDPALPFGGYGDSGVGNASGPGALDAYTRLKAVSIRFDPTAASPGWDLQ